MDDCGFFGGESPEWSVCRLCLSAERAMSTVEDVRWAYQVLADEPEEVARTETLVCWECRALLLRFSRFRRQAARAGALLKAARLKMGGAPKVSGLCLSRLSVANKTHWDAELSGDVEVEFKDLKSPGLPFDMDITIETPALVKTPDEETVIPKVEAEELDDCDVWADAALPVGLLEPLAPVAEPLEPPPPLKKEKKRKRKKEKREKVKVKRETETAGTKEALDDLGDLEGVCERAWERRRDVLKKREARRRSAKFAARRHACASCALAFHTERARAAHARELHCEGPDSVPCELCDCRLADAARLEAHRGSHRVLRCRRCRHATRSAKSMRRHAATHARAEQRQAISCDVCGKQFMNRQHFYIHHKTHTSRQTYECEHCGRAYRTRTQMFRHLRSHRKLFLCDICGKMFSDQTYLNCHYLAHSGAAARRFECGECHKRYINKFKLIVHMRFHTGEKPYRCAICEKSFREKAQLTSHDRKYHQGETANQPKRKRTFERTKSAFVNERFVKSKEDKPETEDNAGESETTVSKEKVEKAGRTKRDAADYVCSCCGKRFKDKWRLKFHLAVHSDERPYKCDECDLTFKYQSGLWTHKLVHKGAKPHQCTICGSQFTQKGNLTAHLKIHTDEKPFECNVCGSKFRMKRNLRNHAKTHTNVENFKRLVFCE